MIPIITPIIKTTHLILRATRDAIIPFNEKPPAEDKEVINMPYTEITGVDLFSHFTADIIREEVIFTR